MENEQNQESFQPLEESTPTKSDGYKDSGWSWGAFVFNWAFALAVRKYWYLLLIFLMFIPLINIFAMIGVMVFFGVKGRDMAKGSTTFSNEEQRIGFMKGIDHAGKIVAIIWLIGFVVGGILAVTVLSSLSGMRNEAEDVYRQQMQQSYESMEADSSMTPEEIQEMQEMQEEMMKFFQE